MKNKKIKKFIYNNVNIIENYLFTLSLIFSISYILINFTINLKMLLFLVINCSFLIIFYVIIRIYEERDIENKEIISNLLKINKHELDNEKLHIILKKLHIEKNILNRDYNILKGNFKKFVPNKFLENITRGFNEKIELGVSIEKDLHIMFIDISGFTNISEHLTAQKALFLLNIYFDGIVEISESHGGYVDKFLGDGIMLIFDNKHSDNIIKTAIEIRYLVNKINIANFKYKINVGIGINSGKATLGTIGSKRRMDITAIGDTVNIAARLEGQTRKEDDWIIFSKDTYELIKNKKDFNIRKLGYRFIKGKEEKIELYSIIDEENKN